ncbi:hypothetical protein Csa_017073 [Cucumis sativus]|uniref:Uncharacterized protein n=1 Tax=Cucumis sativus TaxID=3659 RepID=A0A0A0K744_CUCSA|nr:hypothetical protein Csa_017073 [Cucumis sativus]
MEKVKKEGVVEGGKYDEYKKRKGTIIGGGSGSGYKREWNTDEGQCLYAG